MGLQNKTELLKGTAEEKEPRRCCTSKGEDVNPVSHNESLKEQTGMYGAHSFTSIRCERVYNLSSQKHSKWKKNGVTGKGCNISFSYKSTQEFSLFNFAWGSGFNVGIPTPLEYSVKEGKKEELSVRKSGYLKGKIKRPSTKSGKCGHAINHSCDY